MARTAVYICKISHKKDPQESMHRFPANKDKCKQWLNVDRRNLSKTSYYESAQDTFWMAMPETFLV